MEKLNLVILSKYECKKVNGGSVVGKALYHIGYFLGGIARGLNNFKPVSTGGATRFGEW